MDEDLQRLRAARARRGEATGWATYDGALAARITMGLLGVMLALNLVLMVGKLFGEREGIFAGNFGVLATFALLGCTAIAFLNWFYRAYRATAEAEGTRYAPGQAVWTFFVPILNLFRPYQIATDIWRRSAPPGPIETHGHSFVILLWWVSWAFGRVCPFWLVGPAIQPGHLSRGIGPVAIAGMAEIVSAVAAIAVVRLLDQRIRERQGQKTRPATF